MREKIEISVFATMRALAEAAECEAWTGISSYRRFVRASSVRDIIELQAETIQGAQERVRRTATRVAEIWLVKPPAA